MMVNEVIHLILWNLLLLLNWFQLLI